VFFLDIKLALKGIGTSNFEYIFPCVKVYTTDNENDQQKNSFDLLLKPVDTKNIEAEQSHVANENNQYNQVIGRSTRNKREPVFLQDYHHQIISDTNDANTCKTLHSISFVINYERLCKNKLILL